MLINKRFKNIINLISDILKLRSRKSLKNCVNKNDCKKTNINNKGDKTKPVQSKFIPDLKPTSIFNDYPYEVAILLNNDKLKNKPNDTIAINKNNVSELFTSINDINSITKENNNHKIYSNENKSNNTTLPKRSSKYNYETENRDTIEFITTLNVTNAKDKTGRNVFDKNDIGWHQSAPIPDTNFYKVIPKEPVNIKTVNEKALVKVISTLTKTFKKIMKQHDDIKTIHHKLQGINKDLLKNIANITEKFHDFDIKYINFMKLSDTIKQVESDLAQKEQMFKNKHKEMTINMIEFENQQKKFLAQQKQFYSVQQLILAQNEKINTKQNLIAKTQSEISHRQNNFARILKKAKEMYTNSKNIVIPKIDSSFAKIKNDTTNFNTKQVTYTTTSIPPSSESIKINLFSIPIASRIQNQDEVLMKEKDHHPIDDLVYKFYFNNTLIDKLMKSNVLNSIAAVAENRETRNNVKNKRNGLTTLLLPVNKPYIDFKSKVVQRNKRWISHYSRKHRKHHGKGGASIINAKAKLNFKNNTNSIRGPNVNKTDPFLAMATNFCNEIRRNGKGQVLAWCIEKTLRRLQFMGENYIKFTLLSFLTKLNTMSVLVMVC